MVKASFQFHGGLTQKVSVSENDIQIGFFQFHGGLTEILIKKDEETNEKYFQFHGGLTRNANHGCIKRNLQRILSIPWRINKFNDSSLFDESSNDLSIPWRIN